MFTARIAQMNLIVFHQNALQPVFIECILYIIPANNILPAYNDLYQYQLNILYKTDSEIGMSHRHHTLSFRSMGIQCVSFQSLHFSKSINVITIAIFNPSKSKKMNHAVIF